MISTNNYKKISIHITTIQKENFEVKEERRTMNERRNRIPKDDGKFICSICLNEKVLDNKTEGNRKILKSCPICQKNCDICVKNIEFIKTKTSANESSKVYEKPKRNEEKIKPEFAKSNSITVQTSQADITHGLDLLNEVLTVFQSKKLETTKDKYKTVICRDASVSTEFSFRNDSKIQLTLSKIFQYSIEDNIRNENCKFTVVNSCQPEVFKSLYSIDFNKEKSSSIPQMKVEELKKSLKDKTKSKDAIQEVNRMFATVRRGHESLDDTNRPVVRNGPRVLPVVKTNLYKEPVKKDIVLPRCDSKPNCKCCQTNNYNMSGGDSVLKIECCHVAENTTDDYGKEKCDKSVYMLCCHHESHRRLKPIMMCECCKAKHGENNDDVNVSSAEF